MAATRIGDGKMRLSLNGADWKLKGYWPYVPFLQKSMEIGNELMGVTDWIDAEVPGGVHRDLLRAGLIEDPYRDLNSLKCEWVEHRWWMYRKTFAWTADNDRKQATLVFEGIDYKAHVYVNGVKLGEHEGMFERATFPLNGVVRVGADNDLVVLFEDAPKEMGQIGLTSLTRTQKSRFNYKWDFCTRLVNIGLWDDVYVQLTEGAVIGETFVRSAWEGDVAFACVDAEVGCAGMSQASCRVRVRLSFEGQTIAEDEAEVSFTAEDGDTEEAGGAYEEVAGTAGARRAMGHFRGRYRLESPLLWYPCGAGEQPLYDISVEALIGDAVSDERHLRLGVRRLGYERNPGSPEEALPYTIVVNGFPVYIQGVNLVPLDHLYGCATERDYERIVLQMKAANVNLVRVWGGGLIEKEVFYRLCDEHGLLVWQEFIQSSSGYDNVPSTDPHFLSLLEKAATQAVRTKRNHACHVVWSGGNELMDENKVPITDAHPNIAMLKRIVAANDPGKLFLPSSASGPNEFLNVEDKGKGRNHDVHGSWKYEGIEGHYAMYNESDSLLHSEFGIDGCSSIAALREFLSPDHLAVTDMKTDLVWRHHGEWWDTLARDRELFGAFESLAAFVDASRFMQAEGLRYAVEANRRRQPNNSGSIVWQFNEPWPNASCTSLVEHAGRPKPAYYALRRAFAPLHASLAYGSLIAEAGKAMDVDVHVHNGTPRDAVVRVRLEAKDARGTTLHEREWLDVPLGANASRPLASERLRLPAVPGGLVFVRLTVTGARGEEVAPPLGQTYVFAQRREQPFAALLALREGRLRASAVGQGMYELRNEGEEVLVGVCASFAPGGGGYGFDGDGACLFPGERALFRPLDAGLAGGDAGGGAAEWEPVSGGSAVGDEIAWTYVGREAAWSGEGERR